MFLLKHVEPKDADGKVAEAYSIFPPLIPVPETMQLMSISPDMAYIHSQAIRYYLSHPKLDYGMMAMIRYIIASDINHEFCIKFNSEILMQAANLSDKDLEELRTHPENASLEDFQKAMVLFVLKAIRTPEAVTEKDVQTLHEHGWEDRECPPGR